MSAHIRITGVTKTFVTDASDRPSVKLKEEQTRRRTSSAIVAVKNVSLEIANGERVGIIGRNGAGKSTLLHLIAGITTPSSGSIQVDGKVTAVMTLGIGLRDEATGRENIYLDGEVQGLERSQIDTVIHEVIAFAELGKFIDYPVRTYSTGMKARLAFSMITHLDPEVLIIDEALSAGDAAFSAKATRRIRELCSRGKIVIVVSHGMGTINDICDRCIWMDAGRIAMDGKPNEVTRAYLETVREADEKVLLEKFSQHAGAQSFFPGWVLRETEILADGKTKHLLHVGTDTVFSMRGNKPASEAKSLLKVKIGRLDGVVFFDQVFVVSALEAEYTVQIRMQPLILGTGVYRIDVCAKENEAVKATSSSAFEVVHHSPPRGGKPMLFPSVATKVTKP